MGRSAARQARLDTLQRIKDRRQELKREQKELAAQAKKESQTHQRAVKKMKTLPTSAILQCLRERGADV